VLMASRYIEENKFFFKFKFLGRAGFQRRPAASAWPGPSGGMQRSRGPPGNAQAVMHFRVIRDAEIIVISLASD
jgi:hypothetical protein